MFLTFFTKYFKFLIIGLFLLSCSIMEENIELATFDGGQVLQDDYINHYLLSSQYKPKKVPTEENLIEIVKNKAFEKMSVLEAISMGIDNDSIYVNIISNNERRLLFQKYVQLEMTALVITDSLLNKFYSEFSPQYRMKYIMRPFLKNSSEKFIDSQKEKIEAAYKLLNNGEEFKKVVTEFSQDISSNKKGGDLGWIIRESMGDEALRLVMDTLTQNTYSKPFKGYGGYYIMFKGEKRDVTVPTFENAKQKIWRSLYHSRKNFIEEEIETRFEELVKKYNYIPLNDNIENLFNKLNTNAEDVKSSIDIEKLVENDKEIIIAKYDNGVVLVGDLFADRKKSPSDKSEFLIRFKNISQQHLFAKHAKDINLQNESELSGQLFKMKSSLLRTVLYKRLVKDKVSEKLSKITGLNRLDKVKNSSEIEKTLRSKFENNLINKYNFKFEEKNFNKVLKLALEKKVEQNKAKSTK